MKRDQRQPEANTSSGMYKIRPNFNLPTSIDLPTGMYKLSPVSTPSPSAPFPNGFQNGETERKYPVPGVDEYNPKSPIDPHFFKNKIPTTTREQDQILSDHTIEIVSAAKFSAIEKRQMEILNKLNNLREMIAEIHRQYVLEEENASPPEFIDIVVNANPATPPYSLLFLYESLKLTYGEGIEFKSFVHSSVKSRLHSQLRIFKELEESSTSQSQNEGKVVASIKLIWKSIDDGVELMVNPFVQSPISGEGNVARFLSRLLPPSSPLNYDSLDPHELDRVDGLIGYAENERNFTLDPLESLLRKEKGNSFFLGKESIGDFVVYSRLIQELSSNAIVLEKGLWPHIDRWIDACQKFSGFQLI